MNNNQSIKVLDFKIGNEYFAIDILSVQEIIGLMKITEVPQMPSEMKGVLNLRGKIIPIIDLRIKFNQNDIKDTEKTCIIVVNIGNKNLKRTCGLIVDEVSEVVDIANSDIESAEIMNIDNTNKYIKAVGKINDKVVMIIDLNNLFNITELETLAKAANI